MDFWIIGVIFVVLGIFIFLGFAFGSKNKYRRRNYAAELYHKMAKEESKDHAPKNEHIVVKEDPPKEYVNSFSVGKLVSGMIMLIVFSTVAFNLLGLIADVCADTTNANAPPNTFGSAIETISMTDAMCKMSGSLNTFMAIAVLVAIIGVIMSAFGGSVFVHEEEDESGGEEDDGDEEDVY